MRSPFFRYDDIIFAARSPDARVSRTENGDRRASDCLRDMQGSRIDRDKECRPTQKRCQFRQAERPCKHAATSKPRLMCRLQQNRLVIQTADQYGIARLCHEKPHKFRQCVRRQVFPLIAAARTYDDGFFCGDAMHHELFLGRRFHFRRYVQCKTHIIRRKIERQKHAEMIDGLMLDCRTSGRSNVR